MCDAPEEEENTRGRKQRAHRVHHAGHLGGVAGKLREQVGRQHEERCARWVTDLQFVACVDKLRTVPERGCRLNGGAIDEGRNKKRQPSDYVVHKSELFHLNYLNIIVISK